MASDLLKIGGLWVHKDKNGNEYFSGDFSPFTKILIYKNTYKKEGSSEPDYNINIAPKKKKEESSNEEGNSASSGDDIPF